MQQPGYKAILIYLVSCLNSGKNELLYSYLNKDGKDISDILRGKIISLTEIATLEEAVKNYIEVMESKKD